VLAYIQNVVIATQASLLASAALMLGLICLVRLKRPSFSAGQSAH